MYATYEAKTIIIDRRRPRKIQRRDDEQSMPQEGWGGVGWEEDFFVQILAEDSWKEDRNNRLNYSWGFSGRFCILGKGDNL